MTLARFEIFSKNLQVNQQYEIIVNKSKFSLMFNEPRKNHRKRKKFVSCSRVTFVYAPTMMVWRKNIMHDIFLGECFQGSVFEEKILSWANFSSFSNCISATDTTYFVVERLAGKPKFREIIPILARFETSFSNDSLQKHSVENSKKPILIKFHKNSVNSIDLVVMNKYCVVFNVFTKSLW